VLGCGVLLASVSANRLVSAKPSKAVAACYDDFERSQELRREHRLVEAAAALSHCAVPTCPIAVSRPCEKWLTEVTAALPSVLVRAETHTGEAIKQGTLTIDGAPRGELPVAAISLDPGEHTFVLRRDGETLARATLVLAEGDRNREVLLRGAQTAAEASGPAPPPRSPASSPPSVGGPRRGLGAGPIALFTTSAIGLGVFTVVGLGARSDANDLRARCSPRCSSGEVDGIRTRALVADVGLGVSVVAAAAGLYLALSRVEPSHSASRPMRWTHAALSRVVGGPGVLGLATTHSF